MKLQLKKIKTEINKHKTTTTTRKYKSIESFQVVWNFIFIITMAFSTSWMIGLRSLRTPLM